MTATTSEVSEAKIAVPRSYKDYLVAGRDCFLTVTLSALACLTLVPLLVPRMGVSVDVMDAIIGGVSLVAWSFERKKPWHYTIDRKEVTVIWAQANSWVWDWRTIMWERTRVTGVEQTEWRGQPALCLLEQAKNSKRRPDWLIVYAHEDVERVRTQVLPLIETYRKRYRQEALADRLRS